MNNQNIAPVVTVKQLQKQYGQFEAVKSINFDIYPGETFGLIGPDGAGKTTTFHIMGGVLEKTAGDVLVLGAIPRDARLQMGYLTQIFSLYLDLSIDENMRYVAGLREVGENDFQRRRKQYLQLMDLDKFSNRLAGQLSGGMKQKLALCCALIARPKVLLLDEPTTGVDPVSRREFWDLLATVTKEGVTVAVATPYLDEAERCTRLILMNDGEILQTGSPKELRESLHLHRLEVRANKLQPLQAQLERIQQINVEEAAKSNSALSPVLSNNLIAEVQPYGDRIDVLTPDSAKARDLILSIALQENLAPVNIDLQEPTLENVFVSKLKSKSKAVSGLKFPFVRQNTHTATEIAIEANQINKNFGSFQAVHNVSLKVQYGQIYGLLGANGAGKTTTIKMLCGLLTPSSGRMSLCGEVGDLRSGELRRELGYMSQKFTLYDDLTILENLEFYCGVYCVPENLKRSRIDWVLANSGLLGQENLITGKLPGGWKQRLAFGSAIMHEPAVLFLDEPTSGVDPLARREMWNLIRQLAQNGTAILITTHFLEEAEYCNQLGFMAGGELVAEGSPSKIKGDQPGQLYEVRFADIQAAYKLLKQKMEPWRVSVFADAIHIVLDNPETEWPNLKELCLTNGLQIVDFRPLPYSLEDAFISIIQRAALAQNQMQGAA